MLFDADFTMTINGKGVGAGSSFEVVNPATEAVIASVPDCSSAELDCAVSAARAAYPGWRATPFAERQAALRKLGDAITAQMDGLVRLLTSEQGKPTADAQFEVGGAAAWCQAVSTYELPVHVVDDTPEHRTETRHVPLGVVAGIVPWNFPLLIAIWKLAPALLAGNTVILKPSPYTPLTALKLGELARDLLPAGVFNVVSGGDALGPLITEHPGIDKVSFTGSTATGKRVVSSAAANLKRVTLELGGNDAAIVMPDVNVQAIAQELFWAAFRNNGQVCVVAKRMYIHASIYDEVKEALVAYAATVKVGDGSHQGTELGPVQNKLQYDRVNNLIADAKANGLTFLTGGTEIEGKGYFIPVTIIDNPPEESRVVQEEAFGPVLPLLKFDDVEEVIARANASIYGLAGSVWSEDEEQAAAIAARLETGTVWINEVLNLSPFAAFGGHKQSGIGTENSLDGLLEYTNSQTIMIKRKVAA